MKNRTALLQIIAFASLGLAVAIFVSSAWASGTSTAFDSPVSYGANWEHESRADIAAFNKWTTEYLQPGRGRSLAEGLYLAEQRRSALADLIKSDAGAAIAAAVPVAIRRQLPAEVSHFLETRVSGLGDFSVLGVLRARHGPEVDPVRRSVRLGGKTYRAYVYGRRLGETTKIGIPLHGIVLDGAIALHESVLRTLEPGETPDPAKTITDLSASPAGPPEPLVSMVAEAGNSIYRFASPKQFLQAEAQVERAESGVGPHPRRSIGPVLEEFGRSGPEAESMLAIPDSAWTQGNKNVLVIRVDFSDLPGAPRASGGNTIYTAEYVQNFANAQISPYYLQSSYGLTSLTNTATSPLYRMPHTAAYYATNNLNNLLHDNARAAAAANYTLANYQRIVVLFSSLEDIPGSQITYGGLADIGGPNVWINGEFDFRVVAHELGHTYGLYHANLWQVTDGNPISPTGSSEEYEDDFDTMGGNFADDTRTDFNPWFKNRLDWIASSGIRTVTTSGTYRINRFDNSTGSGILSLKIIRDGSRNYWVSCRRKFTNNGSMQHGAYVIWGYNSPQQSDLLDMTTPGNGDQDAALAIGATFTDSVAHVSIRPMAEGGAPPNEYLDVQVTVLGSNDNFVNAQLVSGRTGSTASDNINATKEPGEPNHAGNTGGKSVWYRWIAPASGVAGFNTFGSNFDTLLAVYRGNAVNALISVASNDDASNNTLQSAVTFNAVAGTPYYIAVDGYNGASGNIGFNWIEASARADFNGDGKSDILWQSTSGARSIWLMNGTVHSSSASLGTVSTAWNIVGSGDFNGDSKADILWQSTSGARAIWIMNGTVHTSSVSLGTVSTAWNIVGSGDFNGDGKADILWQSTSGERAIWIMNGTVHTSTASLGTVSTAWNIAGSGDFNGDSKSDILWQNNTTGERSIWLMNGTVHSSSAGLGIISTAWNMRNY